MINKINNYFHFPRGVIGIIFFLGMVPLAFADVIVNVMAVNGAPTLKETTVKFNLPSDINAQDILDTDGLQLDYNVEDANYYVHGNVKLEGKKSKTFKVHLRDAWKIDADQVESIKKEIEEGYVKLGVPHDSNKAQQLKDYLLNKMDIIVGAQTANSDSIEKRIDAYRTYSKELRKIKTNALAVDYWRSDIKDVIQPKLIHLNIEAENPTTVEQLYKHKHFLPIEVKSENVVEAEGFDVRFDQQRQQSFLFKEEKIPAKEKRKYNIGIEDVWRIAQNEIEYFYSRTKYAFDFLAQSRFADSAKILNDRIQDYLKIIVDSQAVSKPIDQHISSFRENQKTFTSARIDVETLEKLLAVYREDLEKSKINNVMQRVQGLKSAENVSKALFEKKFENSTAWSFIGWILGFVALISAISLVIWFLRSNRKPVVQKESEDEKK